MRGIPRIKTVPSQTGKMANWTAAATAAQRTLESRKADRAPFNAGYGRPGGESQNGAGQKSAKSLEDQLAVTAPHPEADSQYLREKRQEKRGDDNRDRIVFDDARREQ